MATIFQNPIRRINPETGKMENAADAKGKPLFHPKWRAVIVTHKSQRKTCAFGTNKLMAQKQADMIETREREIEIGIRAVPMPQDKNISRSATEVFLEYFTWDRARGGKQNTPWDDEYADKKKHNLGYWKTCLNIERFGDLHGILPKIEKEFRAMPDLCDSAKTVSNKVFSFHSLILLHQKRKYLA